MFKWVLVFCLLLTPFAARAEDGRIGSSSTGSSMLTLTIPPRIVLHKVRQNDENKKKEGVAFEIVANVEFQEIEVKNAKNKDVVIFVPIP